MKVGDRIMNSAKAQGVVYAISDTGDKARIKWNDGSGGEKGQWHPIEFFTLIEPAEEVVVSKSGPWNPWGNST